LEVIEIRTGETQSPAIAGEEDQCSPAELFPTVIAARLLVYNHRAPVSGLTAVPRPMESQQLLVKWTWLLQL